jgi:hypothetical protein
MKDLCVRCDARPALPGKLYCAACILGLARAIDPLVGYIVLREYPEIIWPHTRVITRMVELLMDWVQTDRSQHQTEQPEEHAEPAPANAGVLGDVKRGQKQ